MALVQLPSSARPDILRLISRLKKCTYPYVVYCHRLYLSESIHFLNTFQIAFRAMWAIRVTEELQRYIHFQSGSKAVES